MKLETIGFYTLSDRRAKDAAVDSRLERCELILTNRCNFKCLYCRGLQKSLRADIPLGVAFQILDYWIEDNLQSIRFSGGEPTCYPHLKTLVEYAKRGGIRNIAISTNGSNTLEYYKSLIGAGVNDYSISLDACCASEGQRMNGGVANMTWEKVVKNIKDLSTMVYTTVGIVLDEISIKHTIELIEFGSSLGADDVRIIPTAQYSKSLQQLANPISEDMKNRHPILKYRIENMEKGRQVRGIKEENFRHCWLMLDDMVVAQNYHVPCIIYLREGGNPIGKIGKNMRRERYEYLMQHDPFQDPICSNNCLDVCMDYNSKKEGLVR